MTEQERQEKLDEAIRLLKRANELLDKIEAACIEQGLWKTEFKKAA